MGWHNKLVWVPDAEDARLEAAGYIAEEGVARALGDTVEQVRNLARCYRNECIHRSGRFYLSRDLVARKVAERRHESQDDLDSRLAMRDPGSYASQSILADIERRRQEREDAFMISRGIPIDDEATTVTRAVSMPTPQVSGQDPANDFLAKFGRGSR